MKTRTESEELLKEYVENESLRHHCFMVAEAMEHYALLQQKEAEEVEEW